ncbi:hypothetical protein CLAFUW4_05891 [Fulvia fulva]|uniref:Uncharacterized protein n=1 Tax=Passalora fulva TaxID=5499 RepID=A0A9Q8LHV2_PASFU|nr:uncharacterized protein CLAFUR5_06035 [Fulvia fulva]KAK4623564.1 hypothetical protein CLAFUR4_05885 [Fulvia fulva]KAK4624946.1 hypothetical protein CLAFUR0_05898 [Fulvia fulva]UJO17439.1 hypothetical protein CLAFUR5_06035 [Fulvia fulva]WPV15375.1 hypothetical protein CLAFUW4_05891 [Fulvia fulva]WPV29905.1 hypothetical protein CLAFUW7_05889 [Fulvia fulva]
MAAFLHVRSLQDAQELLDILRPSAEANDSQVPLAFRMWIFPNWTYAHDKVNAFYAAWQHTALFSTTFLEIIFNSVANSQPMELDTWVLYYIHWLLGAWLWNSKLETLIEQNWAIANRAVNGANADVLEDHSKARQELDDLRTTMETAIAGFTKISARRADRIIKDEVPTHGMLMEDVEQKFSRLTQTFSDTLQYIIGSITI